MPPYLSIKLLDSCFHIDRFYWLGFNWKLHLQFHILVSPTNIRELFQDWSRVENFIDSWWDKKSRQDLLDTLHFLNTQTKTLHGFLFEPFTLAFIHSGVASLSFHHFRWYRLASVSFWLYRLAPVVSNVSAARAVRVFCHQVVWWKLSQLDPAGVEGDGHPPLLHPILESRIRLNSRRIPAKDSTADFPVPVEVVVVVVAAGAAVVAEKLCRHWAVPASLEVLHGPESSLLHL